MNLLTGVNCSMSPYWMMSPDAPSIHMTSDGGLESAEHDRLMEPTLCSSTSLVTLEILTVGPSVNTIVSFHAWSNLLNCHTFTVIIHSRTHKSMCIRVQDFLTKYKLVLSNSNLIFSKIIFASKVDILQAHYYSLFTYIKHQL